MRGNHAIVEKPDAIKIVDRARALRFDTVVYLALRFGNMNNYRRAGAIGKCAHRFQVIFGNGVRRMRRNRRNDKRIPFPVRDKLFYVSHRFRVRLIIGDRKIDDSFAEDAAHSGFECLIGDRIFEVIHVAVGRGAAANHFRQAQTRADAHKVFGDVFGFRREDVFGQPLL